ncbi:unnamed protein product, partial [Brassica rapa]
MVEYVYIFHEHCRIYKRIKKIESRNFTRLVSFFHRSLSVRRIEKERRVAGPNQCPPLVPLFRESEKKKATRKQQQENGVEEEEEE